MKREVECKGPPSEKKLVSDSCTKKGRLLSSSLWFINQTLSSSESHYDASLGGKKIKRGKKILVPILCVIKCEKLISLPIILSTFEIFGWKIQQKF